MASLYENTPITLTVSILSLILTAITRNTDGVRLGKSSPSCSGNFVNQIYVDVSKILQGQVSRLFLSHLVYSSVFEGIVGSIVLFSCRQFERQMGSRKYGAFFFMCWILSTLMSVGVSTLLLSVGFKLIPATGPYFFIFAQLAFYYKYIPKVFSRFAVLGVEMSEKSGIYLLAAQILFSHGFPSIIAGFVGFVSGYVYDVDGIGLQKFRFPAFIEVIFRFLGSMLRVLFPSRPINHTPQNQMFPPQPEPTDIPNHNAFANHSLRRRETNQPNNNDFELPPPDEESIQTLVNLGFGREEVIQALRNSGNNLDAAANMLLR